MLILTQMLLLSGGLAVALLAVSAACPVRRNSPINGC